MPRFYYVFCEMDDDSWEYVIFDRLRGSDSHMALTVSSDDAEKIVDALNAPKPGIFG